MRNRPRPSRSSAERFKGESDGSRHSSKGSSKPESHSKVEEVILKQFLNESGLRHSPNSTRTSPNPRFSLSSVGLESLSGKWIRLRFREADRREREAEISWEKWMRGKKFALELE